jgi:hypothetical protein
MTLTLQTIRDHSPCIDGWKTLTKAIGSDLTTELSIGDVLITNGLDDALWCLQCLEPRVRVAAIMPAVKRASVYTADHRVHDCISAIEKWLAGDETVDIMEAARVAARAAAWAAAEAAAWSAAEAAAWAAAWAAEAAAWAAAKAAEFKLQEADLLDMFPPMILKGEQP